MADDPQRQIGQLDGLAGIVEDRFPALFEEELAESPGVQPLVLLDHPELLHIRALRQPFPELRGFPALQDDHLLVPVADLLLQAPDLLAPLPADGTARQEMRDHQPEHLLLLQPSRQPLRQGLQRQMCVFQAKPPVHGQ